MRTAIKYGNKCTGIGLALCLYFFSFCQPSTDRQQGEDNTQAVDDKKKASSEKWITDMVKFNAEQVQLTELAQKKSLNLEVKNIAGIMEIDHRAFINNLLAFAEKENMGRTAMDTTVDSTTALRKLADEKPTDFDKKWCERSVEQHKKLIEKMESFTQGASDSALIKIVNSSLPKMRIHLDHLMICNSKMKE